MDLTLLAACNDLLGLLVLLRNRDDIPAEVKDIMETHWRVRDAKAAVVAALASELKAA